MITYKFENEELKNFDISATSKWIRKVVSEYGKKTGKINFLFCNDKMILTINKQFLNHDYYTDIITFDYSENEKISGDIFISLDTIKSNAKELNIQFEEELDRIIIHGILHLCGFDDKESSSRKVMTEKENLALTKRYA